MQHVRDFGRGGRVPVLGCLRFDGHLKGVSPSTFQILPLSTAGWDYFPLILPSKQSRGEVESNRTPNPRLMLLCKL